MRVSHYLVGPFHRLPVKNRNSPDSLVLSRPYQNHEMGYLHRQFPAISRKGFIAKTSSEDRIVYCNARDLMVDAWRYTLEQGPTL